MKLPERYYSFVLLGVCLLIFVPHLGILPVNIMEARNFVTAREMLHDHHWLLTTFNGEPRYEKPPLPTWITAASGALFGLKSIAALRLPAVLMALLLSFTTYIFGKKLTDNPLYALIGTLIMVTSFYILWAGRNGQWDIFTHSFMMVAIYQFYLMLRSHNIRFLHGLLAGLFLGLSFMSKGPVSLYALFLPFIVAFGWVYRFCHRHDEDNQTAKLWGPLLIFIIVGTVVAGWWYYYIHMHDSQAAQAITTEEISNWKSYNVRPFYYYWNFFIQSGTWAIAAVVSLLYPYLKNRVFDRKAYTFTLIWTLSAVVLLSLIPEKKARYLLPVLIPLALNTGFYIEYLFRRFSDQMAWQEKIPVWLQFGLIGLVGVVVPFVGYWYLKEHLAGNWIWFILLSISLFGIGILIFVALWRFQIKRVFTLTIGYMCALILFGLPLSDSVAVNPQYKDLTDLRDWETQSHLQLYEFKEVAPELIWSMGKPIKTLYKNGSYIIPEENQFGVLVPEDLEVEFRKMFDGYNIKKDSEYDLNTRGREQGGHKARLHRTFYILSKK